MENLEAKEYVHNMLPNQFIQPNDGQYVPVPFRMALERFKEFQ